MNENISDLITGGVFGIIIGMFVIAVVIRNRLMEAIFLLQTIENWLEEKDKVNHKVKYEESVNRPETLNKTVEKQGCLDNKDERCDCGDNDKAKVTVRCASCIMEIK